MLDYFIVPTELTKCITIGGNLYTWNFQKWMSQCGGKQSIIVSICNWSIISCLVLISWHTFFIGLLLLPKYLLLMMPFTFFGRLWIMNWQKRIFVMIPRVSYLVYKIKIGLLGMDSEVDNKVLNFLGDGSNSAKIMNWMYVMFASLSSLRNSDFKWQFFASKYPVQSCI